MLSAIEYEASMMNSNGSSILIDEIKDFPLGFSFVISPTLVQSKRHLIIPHEDSTWQNGTIGVFDLQKQELIHVIPVSKSRVTRALVTKNQKYLLAIGHKRGSLFYIKVYDIEKDYAFVRKINYPIIGIEEGKAGLYVSFNTPMVGIIDITSGKLKKTKKITEKGVQFVDQIKFIEKWNALVAYFDVLNLVMMFDSKLSNVLSKVYLNTQPNNIFVTWAFQEGKSLFISFKWESSYVIELVEGELKVVKEISPQTVITSMEEIPGDGSHKVIRTHFNKSVGIADSFVDTREEEILVSENAQNINWTGVLPQSKEIVCCDFREGLVLVMKYQLIA